MNHCLGQGLSTISRRFIWHSTWASCRWSIVDWADCPMSIGQRLSSVLNTRVTDITHLNVFVGWDVSPFPVHSCFYFSQLMVSFSAFDMRLLMVTGQVESMQNNVSNSYPVTIYINSIYKTCLLISSELLVGILTITSERSFV